MPKIASGETKNLATMKTAYKKAKLYDYNGDITRQWYVFYSYRHPESGEYARFKKAISTKILTKRERYKKANEVIDYINSKFAVGWNPFSEELKGCTNIIEAIDKIFEIKSCSLRPRTIHTYSNIIRIFKRYLYLQKLSNMATTDFNSKYAQEFMDWTMTEKSRCNRTHNNYLCSIKTIFNDMVQRNYCLINPFKNIKDLQEQEPDIVCFSKDELKLLQEYLKDYNTHLYLVSQLIFCCYIRPQELVRLKISDFNLQKQEIIINGIQSKNKRRSIVVLPNHLISELLLQFKDYPSEYYAFSRKLIPGTVEIAPTRIAEIWRKFANLYDIKNEIYNLKHTGIGLSIENGINVRDLQLQIRHSSLELTQIYLDKFNNKASDKIKNQRPAF